MRPRWEEIHFRRVNPISSSFSEWPGFRHSVSKSWKHQISHSARLLHSAGNFYGVAWHGLMKVKHTSMSKSSSILIALPNMKIYCITEANSHMFRILCSIDDSCFFSWGSEASISSRVRFRGMVIEGAREAKRVRGSRGCARVALLCSQCLLTRN